MKLKKIAKRYKDFGLNISCITNRHNQFNSSGRSIFKIPSHPWEDLFSSHQTKDDTKSFDWENAVGVGTFTSLPIGDGRYIPKLCVIDIDGCSDDPVIQWMLEDLGLPDDYGWVVRSGSKNGFHIYYLGEKYVSHEENLDENVVSRFPANTSFENYFDKIEFLWRTHVVLPPSLHSSGHRYEFQYCEFPIEGPEYVGEDSIANFIKKYLRFELHEFRTPYGSDFVNTSPYRLNKKLSEYPEFDISNGNIYLVLDIETHGLPIRIGGETILPELIQIAWLIVNDTCQIINSKSFIIDSDALKYFDESIINIDKENAQLVSFSKNFVLRSLVEDISICDCIVGHNIEFDVEILQNEFLKFFDFDPFKDKALICTMKKATDFCEIPSKFGFKFPTLSELYYKLFNTYPGDLHNAEIDVHRTLRSFKKLKALDII